MENDLSRFNNDWYNPGRSRPVRSLWFLINAFFFQNPGNPSTYIKKQLLRRFGAGIGKGVVLKPSINIKYPWNLKIGDYSWIGENVWLDNLGPIRIGSNVCISQGAFLLTGNHDWSDAAFGLIVEPITIEDGVWIGANATILPGITLASHSVVTAGSVMSTDSAPFAIYTGHPAAKIKSRVIHEVRPKSTEEKFNL